MIKTCPFCKKEKDASEFYINCRTIDGYHNYCKSCVGVKKKTWKKQNPAKVAKQDRRYILKHRDKVKNKITRWRKRHPDHYRAHHAVYYALKKIKIKKMPCEICGSLKLVEGHHRDYSKPLDVVWLCKDHHQEEHKKNNTATNLIF